MIMDVARGTFQPPKTFPNRKMNISHPNNTIKFGIVVLLNVYILFTV